MNQAPTTHLTIKRGRYYERYRYPSYYGFGGYFRPFGGSYGTSRSRPEPVLIISRDYTVNRRSATLWRQAGQGLYALEVLDRRKPQERETSSSCCLPVSVVAGRCRASRIA